MIGRSSRWLWLAEHGTDVYTAIVVTFLLIAVVIDLVTS